jgi:hypothetical protein
MPDGFYSLKEKYFGNKKRMLSMYMCMKRLNLARKVLKTRKKILKGHAFAGLV